MFAQQDQILLGSGGVIKWLPSNLLNTEGMRVIFRVIGYEGTEGITHVPHWSRAYHKTSNTISSILFDFVRVMRRSHSELMNAEDMRIISGIDECEDA
ncbi:hypothetical protein V6N11_035483 [Hibiscus sabdariffa]|uniref:Uncharacterized protein n=2 Tax=Hibiscus sabdariffa TaxID=183260 RepID=A0ABR2AMA9_9ROSI